MFYDYLNQLKQPLIESLNQYQSRQSINPTFIPIRAVGGTGDVIMNIDLIEYLSSHYQTIIYTDHLEAFRYFYRGKAFAFSQMSNYSWYLRIDHLAKFYMQEDFGGFIINEHERIFEDQRKLLKCDPRLEAILYSLQSQYFLAADIARELHLDRRQLPSYFLGLDLYNECFARKEPKKIITIHDGFDVNNIVSGRSTKQWEWSKWNKLVAELQKRYPEYRIIQLGSNTSRIIDGVDECLVNKTTITQAFDILAESSLHIDGDSGLVHAATRLGCRCVVLFGPTPVSFYGYEQNINLTSKDCSGNCYGLTKNWNDKCPIGYPSPICMDGITVDQVMEAIDENCAL